MPVPWGSVISTSLTKAAFTRDSSRPEVCAGDNGEIRLTSRSGNHHFLPCIIWGYLLRMPGRTWPEILARMLTGHVLATHTYCSLRLCHMPITSGGGHLYADLNVGFKWFSLPALFTEEFFLPSLQISPWFITGLNFVFLLIFRSSSLPAQISTSHFLGLKFCNSCKNLPFLGPHDSHKHQNNIRLNHGSLQGL